jgi:hypothetical protein
MPEMLYVTKSAAKTFNFTVKYSKFATKGVASEYRGKVSLLIYLNFKIDNMLTIPSVLFEVYSRKQPF